MPATYLGSYTVGGAVVGLSTAFSALGAALANLRAVVDAQLSIIEDQAAAVLVAKAAIRIPATADFEAQLNASLAISLQIEGYLTDPTAYLDTLISGLAQVSLDVGALVPTVALDAQLDANVGIQAALTAKIAAVDAQLDALIVISAALDAIVIALGEASAAASAALTAAATMSAKLGTAGAYVFLYDGPLGGLGAAIDAVTPSSGVTAGVNVRVPLVFVKTSDGPALSAVNAVYRVS